MEVVEVSMEEGSDRKKLSSFMEREWAEVFVELPHRD